MTPTTTPDSPETVEARDLVERAMRLPPPVREKIAHDLLDSVYPPENPEEVKAAWRAELRRRIEAVRNGTMKTYTIEETMDYLQKVVDEEPAP